MVNQEFSRRVQFDTVAREVFEPLQRYLLRRAPRDMADDVLSDVMLVVWRRLDQVPGEPLPWCYGVARRVLANHRRSARRHLSLVERLNSQPSVDEVVDDSIALGAELEEAIRGLKDDERELIRLWAWEQLEPREIAVVLGLNANSVSLRLGRVKEKLRVSLQRQSSPLSGHKAEKHAKEM